MSTREELAQEFVDRLRRAKSTFMVKAASSGYAPDVRAEVAVVNKIFEEIDSLQYGDGAPVSEADKKSILLLMDEELGLTPGMMSLVKKGSIQMALAYQKMVADLLARINYR